MRILFGVQATGNGHICRSKELVFRLKALGHDVHVVFSGRKPSMVQDLGAFDPYEIYSGLTFHTRRGRLRMLRTLVGLNLVKFYGDIKRFDAGGYDLVVTDYEPITARVARKQGIPSIGFGHQYAFLYKVPISGGNWISRWVLKNFAPVDLPLGLHWHHFHQPILPPILPEHIRGKAVRTEKKILVYLPFEAVDDIIGLLEHRTDHSFFVYGGHLQEDRDHIHLRPLSRRGFLNDLSGCEGVVSNAGFELPSEAISLGKKLLVKPLAGQLEQASNALALSGLKMGEVMEQLDPKRLDDWLTLPPKLPVHYPDVAARIAGFIDAGFQEDIGAFARQVWQEAE